MSTDASSSRVRHYLRGEIIAEEGSPAAGWYVLLSGRVAVIKQGVPIREFATRGMVFGEISSILGRRRTASLVAVEATSVAHFEANLDELIAKHPAVVKTVMVSLAQRLEQTTEQLSVAVNSNLQAGGSGAAASVPKAHEPGASQPDQNRP